MKKAAWSARLAAVILVAASVSCGKLTRQGQASSYLIITSLKGANGAQSSPTFGGFLNSDVIPVFNDPGEVTFQLAMKDPGTEANPTKPSSVNFITIERYHVTFVRSDGHNVEGVDVPYAFDGAVTGTVSDTATLGFTIVRHQAKEEAPLKALGGANQIVISTIAEITFYGHDQTGREVSVTGKISVNFANFANPA